MFKTLDFFGGLATGFAAGFLVTFAACCCWSRQPEHKTDCCPCPVKVEPNRKDECRPK